METRGRFAPSPTGEMHLGNVWTALLAWLDVRSRGGTMLLRIEDLDPDRSRPVYARQLMDDLAWLGLDWDEGPDVGGPYTPYTQDERRHLYQAALECLSAMGLVYPCYCTRAEILGAASAPHLGEAETCYPGTCRHLTAGERRKREGHGRRQALRLQVPEETIAFTDGLFGPVAQNIAETCGDFIVRRSDGVHAYQLAVVVDDAAMRVTRVLRGQDLLFSTPRQLLLYRLLDLPAPNFIHVPLLLGTDGHRLSKRQKDLALAALRDRGVAAERIIGYLAWKAGQIDNWQPVKAAELIPGFTLQKIGTAPVVVDGRQFHD